MKIEFDKVLKNQFDFNIQNEDINFSGYLKKINNNLILCKANLLGDFSHNCDSCAVRIVVNVNENLELFLSDGIYKSEEDNFIDVIEFFDGKIDLNELLNSEIELLKSDYFYCDNCEKNKIRRK